MAYRINTPYLGRRNIFSVNLVRLIEGCWPVKISYVIRYSEKLAVGLS